MPVRQIVHAERRRMLLQKEGMRGVIKESYSGSQCVCTINRMGNEHFIGRLSFPMRGRAASLPATILLLTVRLHQKCYLGTTQSSICDVVTSLPSGCRRRHQTS